jgi:hypothetical protein
VYQDESKKEFSVTVDKTDGAGFNSNMRQAKKQMTRVILKNQSIMILEELLSSFFQKKKLRETVYFRDAGEFDKCNLMIEYHISQSDYTQ